MSWFKKIVGGLSKVLNVIAPIAAFIPGLQLVTVAAMALNVAKGLMQKPPDWKGIITNVALQAIPMGLGKAVQAFKGGTSLEFAKLLSEKFTGTLGEVAKKVGNPQFSNFISQMTTKLQSPEWLTRISQAVNKATNTQADDILSQDLLRRSAVQLNRYLTPVMTQAANEVTGPITAATSHFVPEVPQYQHSFGSVIFSNGAPAEPRGVSDFLRPNTFRP